MNINLKKINLPVAVFALSFLLAFPILAQTTATPTPAPTKRAAASLATIISRADTEIDQRINDLNDLITRINAMQKLSVTEQSTLAASAQNEISQLDALKSKIDIETNAAAAKIDYQSITKSYRIYALIIPQTRIIIAADKVMSIIDSMNTVGNKIKTRISTLSGVSAGPINQEFSDFTAKIGDAGTQATAATNEVQLLQPDQGVAATMQANTAALKVARAKIKTATDDLSAGRKDLGDIASFLKENANK
ncbi:MAG: hypothetical protein ABSA74_02140 [Candidatus Staskawiczbacteria bacterium]|jgi:hypothetical protein